MTTASSTARRTPPLKRKSRTSSILLSAAPGARRKPGDQWRQAAVARGMVDRILLELLAQPPVRFAQRMIGEPRQQVVKRVVAQPDRRPQRGKRARRGH